MNFWRLFAAISLGWLAAFFAAGCLMDGWQAGFIFAGITYLCPFGGLWCAGIAAMEYSK